MLAVRDIMTPRLFTVEADASAQEAAVALTRRHIGGAPARDAEGKLVGVISKSDLVDPEPAQGIRREPTVGELMNTDVVNVSAGEPDLRALAPLARPTVHRSASVW